MALIIDSHEALDNDAFRRVVRTNETVQVVARALRPGENIGLGTWQDISVTYIVYDGKGTVSFDDDEEPLSHGKVVTVEPGMLHDVTADESSWLRLLALYSPPTYELGSVLQRKVATNGPSGVSSRRPDNGAEGRVGATVAADEDEEEDDEQAAEQAEDADVELEEAEEVGEEEVEAEEADADAAAAEEEAEADEDAEAEKEAEQEQAASPSLRGTARARSLGVAARPRQPARRQSQQSAEELAEEEESGLPVGSTYPQ
jgi:mannose-6-phosphate isomerase-like protein (cupin superfamily)